MKALRAGKHVLNEKPTADTAEEAAAMFDYAASKGLVLLDAYHYRFHPALLRVKEIVDTNVIGKLTRVDAQLIIGKGVIKDGDIRYVYELGGGALMDLGCASSYSYDFLIVTVFRLHNESHTLHVLLDTRIGH
jgi:predicted dehydrogenase